MTEAEWIASSDPTPMLRFLRGKASARKLRLFACACCRRIWHLLPDPRSRAAVAVAERFADGEISLEDLQRAHAVASTVGPAGQAWTADYDCMMAAYVPASVVVLTTEDQVAVSQVSFLAGDAEKGAAYFGRGVYRDQLDAVLAEENRWHSLFLRDLFGNPFHPATLDPGWLRWNDGTLPRIAQAIYDERRFADLPILADALEEAGCTSGDILSTAAGRGRTYGGAGWWIWCWGRSSRP